MAARLALFLIVVSLISIGVAADWPQWRGPARNGISMEADWTYQWPRSGPKQLWRAQVGEGFSAVAVKSGRVYTMGNAGDRDTVYCLSAATGKELWRHSYGCGLGDYGGPRATPTVDGNFVYTLSREGHGFCLEATTGKVVWSNPLARTIGAEMPRWGFAGSPLIEGGLAIYNVGSAGIALHKATGRIAWKSGTFAAGYASPVAYTLGGQRGVALFTADSIVGLHPATGRRLWQHPWETSFGVNAADPIFLGDRLFISSNYNRGGAVLRLANNSATVVWQNRNMRNHFNSCILVGGHLYGNDENTLKCLDFNTGSERWRQRGLGKGGLIASNGNLIALTERGMLVILKASPDKYTELASAQVLRGTCWTHPVLANGRIYCRNHEGELVCLSVKR